METFRPWGRPGACPVSCRVLLLLLLVVVSGGKGNPYCAAEVQHCLMSTSHATLPLMMNDHCLLMRFYWVSN